MAKNRGQLRSDRVERLEALGFDWNPAEAGWEKMFSALEAYKEEHGDCNVPRYWFDNPELGQWVNNQRAKWKLEKAKPSQRQANKRGRLSPERVERLESLGFIWDRLEAGWEEMFAALKAYKEEHGDCNVPIGWPDNPRLAVWVREQRRFDKKQRGQLSSEKVRRLKELGLDWNPLETAWEEMFVALQAYKEEHGDCNVPHHWADNPKLGRWVGTQRYQRSKGKLNPTRIHRLEAIGFVWDRAEATWEKMFAALKDYKNEHGDCNVPQQWPRNPSLAAWVSKQRTDNNKGRLRSDRVKRLEEIGFDWSPAETHWNKMAVALQAYKKKHGDCNVPTGWPGNRKLADWVNHQRNIRARGKLSDERIARLNRLGFRWLPGR
jgi:hypothetical protein